MNPYGMNQTPSDCETMLFLIRLCHCTNDRKFCALRSPYTMKKKPYTSFHEEKESRVITPRLPDKAFCGLIGRYYLLEGKDYPGQCQEILPKSNYRLVFILNDPNGGLYFLGPNMKMRITPMQDYFVVHFRQGMMPRLADIKPIDMAEQSLPLRTLLGTETATLSEELHAARGMNAKQSFMEKFFKKSRIETFSRDGLCVSAAEIVERRSGRIKVADLAECLGANVRKIERSFLEEIGVSPKRFIRLIRFQNVLTKLKADKSFKNLADLAYACGYADQSHLIREFKAFSHKLPGHI